MNDAERDAWLREALRHAPDTGALPPRELSESILASARAAARSTRALPPRRGSRSSPASPVAAFWAWLGRPSVAAGLASVLAATLVGLLWWDQPMDQTLGRRGAELARERSSATPMQSPATQTPATQTPAAQFPRPQSSPAQSPPVPSPPAQSPAAQPTPALPTRPAANANAALPADAIEARRERESVPSGQRLARDAKVAPATNATGTLKPAPEAPTQTPRLQAESKREAPTPFPRSELQGSMRESTATPALKKDADGSEPTLSARNSAAAPTARSDAPAAAPADKSLANSGPIAAAPTAPMRSVAPAAPPPPSEDLGSDARRAAPARSEIEKARRAAAPSVPLQRAGDDASAHEGGALSSSGAAAPRDVLAAAAAPLAPVLAALDADPAQWSRRNASGALVALDGGWHDWLLQLDAAAAGRWSATSAAGTMPDNARGRDGATTLRLVARDGSSLIVRLERSAASIDNPAGEHWQASLSQSAVERLRTAAGRLAP